MTDSIAPTAVKRRRGCAFFAAAGCLALTVLLVLAGTVVYLNIDAIKSSIQSSSFFQNVGGLFKLRALLVEQYSCGDVELKVSMKAEEGEGRTLTIKMTNPVFPAGPDVDEKAMATEVARFALEHFDQGDDVGTVKVGLYRGTTGPISVTNGRTYVISRSVVYGGTEPSADDTGEGAEASGETVDE